MCTFDVPNLLLYIYVPTLIASFLLGFFVYLSNKNSSSNKNLFIFIMFLCFWILCDLATWFIHDVNLNLFFVRIFLIVPMSLLFFLFFTYIFVGKELSKKKKIYLSLPFVPLVALMFTNYNAYPFDASTCTFRYGPLLYYAYFLGLVYLISAIINLVYNLKKKISDTNIKNQIEIIIGAIVFIVLWFFVFVGLANSSFAKDQIWGDDIFLFIPVGIVIFISLLAYAITKYQFLKIKLIAAQALTYAIWILIGSQYFFADSIIVFLLVSLTLLLSILFGIILIKSIKQEEQRKEELQLMADKLAVANDQLRKLDNAKTEFISIASHQLRTPITAIKGFASLVLEGSYGELSDGVHGAMEKIFESSERLVTLIEDLLNVSRIESGRMQFEFKPASVQKLLKELYDNFLLVAKTKKFYLDLHVPEDLPEVTMDYSKIRELVSNFIDNALKYTEKGGATIKAEIKDFGVVIDDKGYVIANQKSPYGKVVRITVSDTGIGIPYEEIPYLFKKFSRGKDVSRLHVGGTGLGLYVGKAIADAHHGQVWVESDGEGKGSRFMIEIPLEAKES